MKSFFGGSGRFDPSPAVDRIPITVIRMITAADHDSCVSIYQENETNHLPNGYLQEFEQDLSSDAYLWLGVEEAGILVGMGAVRLDTEDCATASLAFGMVRPDRHRMGYGSALLLARIAALPPPDPVIRVFMSSLDKSAGFYKRFGFVFVKGIPMEDRNEFDWYYAKITRPYWEASRAILASGRVVFDPEAVLVPNNSRQH